MTQFRMPHKGKARPETPQARCWTALHRLALACMGLGAAWFSVISIASAACATPTDVPALTAEQQIELETAIDGRDHREQAFYALLDNARLWLQSHDGLLGDAAVRLHPDWDAIERDPKHYRGDLIRVDGRLEQQSSLDPLADDFRGLFIRDDAGRAILAFVPARLVEDARDGSEMVIVGRYYKMTSYIARDGEQRAYPTVVGAHVRRHASPSPSETGMSFLAVIAILLMILLLVFAAIAVYVRRQRLGPSAIARSGRRFDPELLDEPDSLPDDPVDAMTELRRYARRDERP